MGTPVTGSDVLAVAVLLLLGSGSITCAVRAARLRSLKRLPLLIAIGSAIGMSVGSLVAAVLHL